MDKHIEKWLTPPVGKDEIEADAEKALKRIVTYLGGYCFKLKFVSIAGAPDRIIFMPGARLFFVELKRLKGGKLEKSQEVLFPRLARLGFKVHIVAGLAGVRAFYLDHLVFKEVIL